MRLMDAKLPENVNLYFDDLESEYKLIHVPTKSLLAIKPYNLMLKWTRPQTVMHYIAMREMRERGLK